MQCPPGTWSGYGPRFCAVVCFLCAYLDLDSSVGYHPHLQLRDNVASSHRRFAYTALSLHSGSRIVFPKHGRGIVARWRRSRSSKVSVFLTDPPIGSPRPPRALSLSLSTHLSTHLSTYISSLRSSPLSGNNWDGNYKFGIFGSCEIIFARLDFDFATASKMITFLRFLLPAYFSRPFFNTNFTVNKLTVKTVTPCLLPHASRLRGERSSCFSSATSWKASSHFQAGTATCCELGAAKRQLQLLLLLLLLIMGSFLRGKHFSKVLHH